MPLGQAGWAVQRAVLQHPPIVQRPVEFDLQGLQELVGKYAIDRLRRLGQQVNGAYHNGHGPMTVWHINSSGVGGGVADILNYLVPLSTQIGVPMQWIVIGGDERFFQITKTFHNALQGDPEVTVTSEMLAYYRRVLSTNAVQLDALIARQGWPDPALIVIHDPQPAGLIHHWRRRFPKARFVWRGHLHFDVAAQPESHPGRKVWEFLTTSINEFDAAIFHLPELVPDGLKIPVRCILPAINPQGYLNRDLSSLPGQKFIHSTLAKYHLQVLHDAEVPLLLQNARFDPWKDPLGVIQAYREATARLRRKDQRRPHLLLLGPIAEDDPEAQGVLAELQEEVNGDRTVHILPLVPNGKGVTAEQEEALRELGIPPGRLRAQDLLELEVNAFQTRADVLIAKSLREGFGLTVTGAGYHGKPRIVSQVGGIPTQVTDANGDVYACLVGGEPRFSREASIRMTTEWIVTLLTTPEMRRELGERARGHVIDHFLPHRHLEDYFQLFLDLRAQHEKWERAVSAAAQPGRRPHDRLAGVTGPHGGHPPFSRL